MGDRLHKDLIRKIQVEQMNVSCLVVPTTQYRSVHFLHCCCMHATSHNTQYSPANKSFHTTKF